MGCETYELPVVGCAPEWMSEKAVSIGNYVVSTGIDTFLGVNPYTSGSDQVEGILKGELENWIGAKYFEEHDMDKLADMMIERIEYKRAKLASCN